MRERVTLLTATTTSNAVGEEVATWTEQATVWAARQALTLREVNRQAGLQEQAEAKFVIRSGPDVTTANQVEHAGVRYEVTQVEPAADRASVSLMVRRA